MVFRVAPLLALLILTACGTAPERPGEPYAHLEAWRNIERWGRTRAVENFAAEPASTTEHPSAHVRARAARALGGTERAEAVPLLLAMAAHDESSSHVASEIAFALGQLHDTRATSVLLEGANHSTERVRVAAVRALGQLRPSPAADAVSETAEERLHEQRNSAILAALDDPSASVRAAGALAAFWHQATETGGPRPGLDEDRAAWVVALAERLSKETHSEVRWRLAYALNRIDSPAASTLLLPYATDPHPWVRAFAAEGLGRPPIAEAVEPLRALLDDSATHWTGRVLASRTLQKLRRDGIGDPARVRDLLVGRLHVERNPLVREALIDALAEGGGALEADLLRAVLERPGASLTERRAALRAIGKTAASDALPHLRVAVKHDDPLLRVAAVRGLAHAGSGALPVLRECTTDADVRVRTTAVDATSALETAERWDVLRPLLADPDFAVRASAVAAFTQGRPAGWLDTALRAYRASPEFEHWETRLTVLRALADPENFDAVAERSDAIVELLSRPEPCPGVRHRIREWATRHPEFAWIVPSPVVSEFDEVPYQRTDPWDLVGRENPRWTLETTHGSIVIELFLRDAPEHVSAAIARTRAGYYDGLLFHRVVPAFVLQGGDPRGDGWGDAGRHLPHEINPRPYLRGSVGMPTAGPDTGGGQLFIDHLPTPHLDGRYTVFGRVILGMEVVDRLEVGDRILRATIDENQFWETVPESADRR
ncbi:MAG: HEAT repeat domain-containing protein [Planctomycetota bacterium]